MQEKENGMLYRPSAEGSGKRQNREGEEESEKAKMRKQNETLTEYE